MARISLTRARSLHALVAAALLSVFGGACATPDPPLTAADAEVFLADAEARLLDLWSAHRRAAWVHQRFETDDTAAIAAAARRERLDGTARLAHAVARFDGAELPESLRRKMHLLRTALAAVGPAEPGLRQELSDVLDGMRQTYYRSAACTMEGGACLDRPALERLFNESRETDERLDAWLGWRRAAASGRPGYRRFVELANAGARELGYADTGAMWRSAYDMQPDAFSAEIDRVWGQIRPLYESLHCLVRARLGETYGTAVAPPDAGIPAHLLGSPWGGEWVPVYDLVRPRSRGRGPWVELTQRLERRGVDTAEMVRNGEHFFRSLGFSPLPATFWERSRLGEPADRDVGCRTGAWQVDVGSDVRLSMCTESTAGNFVTAHQVLGRTYYQNAYQLLDPLFRAGAAGGFESGVARAIGLSMTPDYLARAGLFERAPAADDIGTLLRRALDAVPYVPFGLAVDRWRWSVFSGEVAPESYNRSWWGLRGSLEGIRPAVPHTETGFDPGAAAPVAANAPAMPGVVGRILQFQFHRALCAAAGVTEALHRCSIFESPEAGARLRAMIELGASRPWPDALEAIAGTRTLDATPMLDYFEPLAVWLDEQNEGRSCGWPDPDLTVRTDPIRRTVPRV
jgi:peptidyl-dipeptidase A